MNKHSVSSQELNDAYLFGAQIMEATNFKMSSTKANKFLDYLKKEDLHDFMNELLIYVNEYKIMIPKTFIDALSDIKKAKDLGYAFACGLSVRTKKDIENFKKERLI